MLHLYSLLGILPVLPLLTAAPHPAPLPAGETVADAYPPTGTAVDTALFPGRTDVGYPHVTRTGAAPFAFVTAPAAQFPEVQGSFGPVFLPVAKDSPDFDPIYSFGYLSPRYSLPRDAWGAGEASPIVPETCTLNAVHLLMRHGARYPTAGDAAELFAARLEALGDTFQASGELSFMNEWKYRLGSDILVPFGRQQCYQLGVRSRMAYGRLLGDFYDKGALPVFRTGSIDRMVETMESFAQGFFGRDAHEQYSLQIAIEAKGINATVYPGGGTCPNSDKDVAASKLGMAKFVNATFASTAQRLQKDIEGYAITPADVQVMLSLCAYESLSLGYSEFCQLFTQEDFRNMQYAYDIMFYYGNGFGGQTTAAQGKGWVQEFLARLTHTPIPEYDSSTNSTLNGNIKTFPLNQSIYADASHDSYIMSTFVALNLTALNTFGALPINPDCTPEDRTFFSSKIVPFNTNFVAQVMTCDGSAAPQIRFILIDAVVPLHSAYSACAPQADGLCALTTVVKALETRMDEIDYDKACNGPIVNITDAGQLRDSNGLPY